MKLVLIEWDDAVSDQSGWKDLEKVRKQRPERCKSVGFLVAHTKTHMTLAASIVNGHCDGDVTIPTGMVRKVTELCPRK